MILNKTEEKSKKKNTHKNITLKEIETNKKRSARLAKNPGCVPRASACSTINGSIELGFNVFDGFCCCCCLLQIVFLYFLVAFRCFRELR